MKENDFWKQVEENKKSQRDLLCFKVPCLYQNCPIYERCHKTFDGLNFVKDVNMFLEKGLILYKLRSLYNDN